jgi:hypothetical protein
MGTMKILIHDERPDTLECLLEGIVNRGYKGGIAKDGLDVINMLSDERYNIVLTNGGYEKPNLDQRVGDKIFLCLHYRHCKYRET